MLHSWLPFLIYGLLAFAIPASMIAMSFIFATAPDARRTRARVIPFESGVSTGPAEAAALHGQLLPDGDALHRLRHRDRVPLSARGDPRTRSGGSAFVEFALLRPHPALAYVYIWRKGALEWR